MTADLQKSIFLFCLSAFLTLFANQVECKEDTPGGRDKVLVPRQLNGFQLRANRQYQDCVNDLFASDLNDDLKVQEEEYLAFISTRSRGEIDLDEYSNLPFSLISNFVYGSCFCSFVLGIPNCCVGANAGIGLDTSQSPFIEDNLVTICITADEAIRNEIGTFPPTISQTDSPTFSPNVTTTEDPSGSPTTAPTIQVTADPSGSPTTAPTIQVTAEPSGAPTDQPSPTPTNTPTNSPTVNPTIDPTSERSETLEPTPEGLLCLNFQYSIQNDDGLTADDIENEFNNTFKDDLIVATRDITIQILNETFPGDEVGRSLRRDTTGRHRSKLIEGNEILGVINLFRFELDENDPLADVQEEEHSGSFSSGEHQKISQGRRRAAYLPETHHISNRAIDGESRQLAVYTDSFPPDILNIIDNNFLCEEDFLCAFVETKVCVFLEEGDDKDNVKQLLLDGFERAFEDGTFENAVPTE